VEERVEEEATVASSTAGSGLRAVKTARTCSGTAITLRRLLTMRTVRLSATSGE
jgi:hypothetical protein